MKKYIIKYPRNIVKLEDNKIIIRESDAVVADYTNVLELGLSIYENESDILVEGVINDDEYEIMITPYISIEFM